MEKTQKKSQGPNVALKNSQKSTRCPQTTTGFCKTLSGGGGGVGGLDNQKGK